jgi:hypothetical protein
VAQEWEDGRDGRAVIIEQFDIDFAVAEPLDDTHAGDPPMVKERPVDEPPATRFIQENRQAFTAIPQRSSQKSFSWRFFIWRLCEELRRKTDEFPSRCINVFENLWHTDH